MPFEPNRRPSRLRGFTLVELTIVLVVAGILFGGLWRLMSGSSSQLTASGAAAQQTQLINATKAYMASTGGQGWLSMIQANSFGFLPIPPVSSAPDGGPNAACISWYIGIWGSPLGTDLSGFCNYMPAGFSSATTNPYNQNFTISILKDNNPGSTPSNPAGTAAHSYSFMIATGGGNTIPDTQGGAISSGIGGDGGFIYSNNVCNNQTGVGANVSACGAYGSWAANIGTYGFGADSGHVASRTFVSPTQDANQPWLARLVLPGDTAVPGANTYNTMQTPLGLYATGGSPNLYLNGGQITSAPGGDTSTLFLKGTGGSTGNPQISINSGCLQTSPGSPNCPYAIQITGDAVVTNFLQVNKTLYANSDIRLKTNIATVQKPLDAIMRINPVSFNYRAGGQKSLGVIAQELAQVYPELVTTGPGMLAVNYQGLIAPLIGAVQELKHQNDDLRLRLKEQATREDRLEQLLRQRGAQP